MRYTIGILTLIFAFALLANGCKSLNRRPLSSDSDVKAGGDPKTLTEEQRLEFMLQQLKKELAGHKAAIEANPNLEFKSIKCTQAYVREVLERSIGVPPKTVEREEGVFSVVVFFSTLSEETVKTQCYNLIRSAGVQDWFRYVPAGLGAAGIRYNNEHFSLKGSTQFEPVRHQGYSLIEKDFTNIARTQEGKVSYVTGYFKPDWFQCDRNGKPCLKSFKAASSFCTEYKGRLPTREEYLVIRDEILNLGDQYDANHAFWVQEGEREVGGYRYRSGFHLNRVKTEQSWFIYLDPSESRPFMCINSEL